ncbi:MAG: hypothetical protein PHS02_01860 [Candidatus ainarchaeum sp.]|nr:hypothetical protein [Candidatus ainarchaeum sp.]
MGKTAQGLKDRPQNNEAGLAIFRRSGAIFEEGIIRVERARLKCPNLMLVSSKEIRDELAGEHARAIINGIPCYSGTICGFLKPGKKFGRILEHTNPVTGWKRIIHVPVDYRGEKNCALVGDHPNYSMHVDLKNKVMEIGGLELVERFPPVEGFYFGDPKHDIPQGEKVNVEYRNKQIRWLYREGAWVGPVLVTRLPLAVVLVDCEAWLNEISPFTARMIVKLNQPNTLSLEAASF